MGTRGSRRLPAIVLLATLSLCTSPGGTLAPWMALTLSAQTPAVAPDAPWPRRYQVGEYGR